MATATANKTARTLQSSGSNSAGGTTNGTGLDLRTTFGGLAMGRITNGGTGPTVGCDFVIQTSTDNSTWREYARQTAGTTASQSYDFPIEVPPSVMYVRSVFTGNTGQAVSVECSFHELSSISIA